MPSTIKNTSDLRKMLLEVIADVRAGNIDYRDANAIGGLSSQILKSAKLDFDVIKAGVGTDERPAQPAALVSGDGEDKSESGKLPSLPAKAKAEKLSDVKRNKVLSLKAEGKPLHFICDAIKAESPADKKLVAAVFYNKTDDETE